MSKPLICEACKGEHRVLNWRTPAGGQMRLCILCRHALVALAQWQDARRDTSLDALIAQLPAYMPTSPKMRLKLWQQDIPTPGTNSRPGQKYSTP